jgi:mannose-6-phosphate isomerase-like protein (cupin superfamily)
MAQIPPTTKAGKNFTMADLGQFSQLQQFTFETPKAPMKLEGKVFLKQILNLTSCEVSLNNLPPKISIPFYHKHRLNEEIYIFVRGKGEFQIDDCVFPLSEGTMVRVAPDGERCLRNTSKTEDLCWIVIQSRVDSYRDRGDIQDGFGTQKRVSWDGKEQL